MFDERPVSPTASLSSTSSKKSVTFHEQVSIVRTFDNETYDRTSIPVDELTRSDIYEVLLMRARFKKESLKMEMQRKGSL